MTCSSCRRFVPDGAARCPACGTGFKSSTPAHAVAVGARAGRAASRVAMAAAAVNHAMPAAASTPSLPLPQELPEGTQLANGRFYLGPVLGRGCFGTTFRAVDRRLARLVAIKEFFPEGSVRQDRTILPPASLGRDGYEQERAQFINEARTLARFHRPGIVAVYEVFEENDTAYMVMEYLAGRTLVEVLRERGGPLPPADAVRYILAVADALAAVHEQHLLHRDVKPGNIMITGGDEAVLIDFGAARSFDRYQRTSMMTAIGTPGYAPLEQWGSSGRFGPASDIYALAATLYHLLTGRMPPSAADRASQDLLIPPRALNPDVPPGVNDAVLAALAVHMDARPQTMAQFAAALRAGAGAAPASAPAPARAATPAPASAPSVPAASPATSSPATSRVDGPPVFSSSDYAPGQQLPAPVPPSQPPAPQQPTARTGLLSWDTGRTLLLNAAMVPLAPPVFAASTVMLVLGVPALACASVVLPENGRRTARRALKRSVRSSARGVALSARWLGSFIVVATGAGMAACALPLVILGVMVASMNGNGGTRRARRYARRQARHNRRHAP